VGESAQGEGIFDDDIENALPLAAIEAELKPKVLETFDNVADAYKRLRRLQDQDIEFKLKNTTLSPAQERRYKKLKNNIITEVKSLRLRQSRIDSLVDQLYDINKRLVGHEGKLMRLAENHGISREDFLKSCRGSELDPLWLNRVSKLSARGWRQLVATDKDKIRQHRHDIQVLAGETGSRQASSARSCTWCRGVSEKRAKPRRRWWRLICASSSRSPKNTPIAACSSST
jgi:RNA polymerase primary sigma factor